ncbi:UPF0758 domain-containing protein [Paenarthrobacter sp. PH39-S1]|uniref:UPF0758 domain-containing protein n=1 Tax=Paenarthrobacter sp. PH39-S1 TaxID=3046204 RepID=UPI0024B87DEA|nr:UPF0758 domain-containing protein [Paenarthrobacter sp. PH39-S1]MDJ0355215.1 hypothetical protein [Paenarthrobacter sp. PH39-S1]
MRAHRAIAQMATAERPRERLRRVGVRRLRAAELLAVIIGSGLPGCSSLELAARILKKTSGAAALTEVTVEQLLEVDGVGPALAMRIVAGCELTRRALSRGRQDWPRPNPLPAAMDPYGS